MPALLATDYFGTITWLGVMPHRDRPELDSAPLAQMPLTFAGHEGDCHAGLTRPSCSRVTSQYAKGTVIRNTRQVSLVSAEDLAEIALAMDLAAIDPLWVGASVVVSGIPDFSHLPPSARLQADDGATLAVDMQNRPCQFPAKTIDALHPGTGRTFKTAAVGRRGVTAWVECEGTLRLGDRLRVHIPDQRAWLG